MAEFPALPLWTDAYLADTRHLTTPQHGAYLLLLMEAWRRPNTSLPDDDNVLSKLAGFTLQEWADAKPTVLAFFTHDNRTKTWSQKRLNDEKTFVKKNSKKQRSNAKSRWDKEKDISHGNANNDAKPMPNASQNDAPTPTPTPTPSSVVQSDAFRTLETIINALPELDVHPLKANPNISPIFALIQEGFDIQTEILPVIKSVLVKAKPGSLRSWSYFQDRIRDNRTNNMPKPANTPQPFVTESSWAKRLAMSRNDLDWDVKNWGPMPNQPGCVVPKNLITEEDGVGWKVWKPTK